MKQIFLVTGNAHKLEEWRSLLPEDIEIDSVDIDLTEIQSMDPEEIVADKAKRAYEAVGKPVVVEDVSAALHSLKGLPGPFVKFFVKSLGSNALFTLTNQKGDTATVSCSIAYYDGKELITVRGDVEGTIVSHRGEHGFGFDGTFIPDGQSLTYAEMGPEEKNKVSHRSRAVKLFIEAFRD